MSEARNNPQELRELRVLRDMYQARLDSKFEWNEDKKNKSLMNHYQAMLNSIKIKIDKLENK